MKIGKVEKRVGCLYDKEEYVIRNLKQTLNHELALKKVHGVIKFYQKSWLNPYVDMNTDLRKKVENDLKKIFFLKLMIMWFLEQNMYNIRKYR